MAGMADHSLEAKDVPQERQRTLPNDLKTQDHVFLASQRCGLLLSWACGFLQGPAFLQGPSTSWLKACSVYITVQRIQVMKTDAFCFYLQAWSLRWGMCCCVLQGQQMGCQVTSKKQAPETHRGAAASPRGMDVVQHAAH